MNFKSLQGIFLGVSEEVISLRVKENEAALPPCGCSPGELAGEIEAFAKYSDRVGCRELALPSVKSASVCLTATLIGHLHRVSSLGIFGLP